MNIEVTKETFDKLFDENDFISTDNKESYIKEKSYNKETNQKGMAIYNHISSVWQYYLTDINA